ncbi:MAG: hypothetical protein CME68_01155 [Halobacteriovoraceae bacterium]|nr:hypothetical protein [Halobacteriovoraceae bacterium]
MIESPKKLFKSTIGRILILRILVFSGLITLFISIYQIYDDYTHEIASIEREVNQIKSAYQSALAHSLWNFNTNQIKQIIRGLANFPSITFIEITDTSGDFQFSAGSRQSNILIFDFPLIFSSEYSKKQKVGSIYIQSSRKPVLDKIRNRVLIIIFSQGIKTFIVSIFIILLIKVSITDHLHDISESLATFKTADLNSFQKDNQFKLIHLSKKNQEDEIDIVVKKMNTFLTELYKSTAEVHSLNFNLERLVDLKTKELKTALLQNENLIRVLIHDIGNPLSGIIFSIDRITRQYSLKEPIQGSKLKLAQESCDKILEIINFVKDIKSLESGKKQLTLTKMDLFPIIESIKENFHHQLRNKKLELKTSYSKKPFFVMAERISLSNSVLSNLISNAIKFSHFGSIITIECFSLDDKAFVAVKNLNAEIPSEILKDLFDFHKATTIKGLAGEEGTGFGLPIVKMFAQHNNGDITVTSTQNETIFTLSLQLAPSE